MSYDKFKANVMAANILEERERVAVFPSLTNREYEGVIKNVGDSVTIKGAGKITMTSTADGLPILYSNPETIEGTNAILSVKHQVAFNFMVPDIDAAQGAKGAMSVYEKQAGVQMANEQDKFIAGLAVTDPLAVNMNQSPVQVTNQNVLGMIDAAIQALYEQDVPTTEKLTMVVPPRFWMLLKQNYVNLDTDNSDMIKRGALAMYGGVDIKMSNNVATSGNGANDHIMLMTSKAIAFVDAITKIEGKRANNYMADEVRGLSLFDGKIIRPKELRVLNVKYTA